MAELSTQDVVDQSQSVGDLSPSDAPATTSNTVSSPTGEVDVVAEVAQKENGIHNAVPPTTDELEDVSVRSDTDTSRADGSVTGDKATESKPVKKFSVSKPVSFAKYSVPKVIAANAAKGTDKGMRSPIPVVEQQNSHNLQLCLLRVRLLRPYHKVVAPGWSQKPRALYSKRQKHTNRSPRTQCRCGTRIEVST